LAPARLAGLDPSRSSEIEPDIADGGVAVLDPFTPA
jgi:hypothetical protein